MFDNINERVLSSITNFVKKDSKHFNIHQNILNALSAINTMIPRRHNAKVPCCMAETKYCVTWPRIQTILLQNKLECTEYFNISD